MPMVIHTFRIKSRLVKLEVEVGKITMSGFQERTKKDSQKERTVIERNILLLTF